MPASKVAKNKSQQKMPDPLPAFTEEKQVSTHPVSAYDFDTVFH